MSGYSQKRYQARKAEIAAQRREYYRANKVEISAKHRVSGKQYYRANKAKLDAKHRAYYATHKEEVKETQRKWFQKHKIEIREQQRKFRQTHPANVRQWYLKQHYGLSQEGYNALLAAQGGCCAICGTKTPGGHGKNKTWFRVDHDHQTEKVRGLLCNRCNLAIGLLCDDLSLFTRSMEYLKGNYPQGVLMSRAKFKVSDEKPVFNKASSATVVISRLGGVFTVRPHRRRKTYSLPLSEVAQMVMWRIMTAEAEAKLLAKRNGKPKLARRKRL